MPLSRSRFSCTPSVAPIAVNEWPAPIGFTRAPRAAAAVTTSCSSAIVAGRAIVAGWAVTVPAQFVQEVTRGTMYWTIVQVKP